MAQDFPNKSIKMLVGFPAGGPSDVPARIIGEKLRVSLGQPVVIENKTGAAGMIALNDMLTQPRDGHTLLLCSYIDPTNTHLYKKVSYKLEDLAPVTMVSKAYYAFVVPESSPANSIKDFIALAKSKPGELNYGKVGTGSVTELLPKQLEKDTGIKMTGVTFRGTGPVHPGNPRRPARFRRQSAGGRDAALCREENQSHRHDEPRTSSDRAGCADAQGAGVNIVNYGWWGVCAASGTPKPILETLNKHVADAVKSDDYTSTMGKTGAIPISTSVDEFGKIINETASEAATMLKDLGIEQIDQ